MFAVRLANPKSITIAAHTKDNTTIYAIAIGYGGPDIGDELSIKCVVPKAGSVRLRTHALAARYRSVADVRVCRRTFTCSAKTRRR